MKVSMRVRGSIDNLRKFKKDYPKHMIIDEFTRELIIQITKHGLHLKLAKQFNCKLLRI